MAKKIEPWQILALTIIALGAFVVWDNQRRKKIDADTKNNNANSVIISTSDMADAVKDTGSSMVSADGSITTKTKEQEEAEEREFEIRIKEEELLQKAKKYLESVGVTEDMLNKAGKNENGIKKYATSRGWDGN